MSFLQIVATTFLTIFLAELGDKTQLATFSFATSDHSKLAVFVGAALALVTTSALAVLAGSTLAKFINPTYLRIGSGILFLLIGALILLKK